MLKLSDHIGTPFPLLSVPILALHLINGAPVTTIIKIIFLITDYFVFFFFSAFIAKSKVGSLSLSLVFLIFKLVDPHPLLERICWNNCLCNIVILLLVLRIITFEHISEVFTSKCLVIVECYINLRYVY